MRASRKTRIQTPIRYKAIRVDASVSSAEQTIEREYKLPKGSVKLVYPSGRKARADASIGTLIEHWNRRR